ncbi:hypothetical protein [Falsiroseomonas sp. E2-1-a20]|uniref:hypothetical protein n=1 Tax=Falsiroseomonas sp. E2-1-a20 TaxID=3239300 RepID=UPI003F31096E
MTLPLGARLAITIGFDDAGSRVSVHPLGVPNPVTFEGDLRRDQLPELFGTLRADLIRLREGLDAIGGLRQTERSAWQALKILYERGFRILLKLLGDDSGAVREIVEICRDAWPGWATPAWAEDALAPPLITVAARVGDGIPVEILPLFDFSQLDRPESFDELNLDALGEIACRFVGFSAIVQRIPWRARRRSPRTQPGSGRRLENLPRLPIANFYYRGLPGLARTEAFFAANSAHIALDPVWPDATCPTEAETLARELAVRIWERAGKQPAQLHHFYCHCETERAPAEAHTLRFHTGSILWGERRVTLGDLGSALARLRLASDEAEDVADRPLIFLNACASAAVDPSGIGSFPEIFADERFLGFIGTETVMPDAFASAFAEALLTRLLLQTQPEPLGRALHRARWDMLRRYKNPLGLLYSAYADPDLQVRRSPDAVRNTTSDAVSVLPACSS